jgi:hypothetical protein
MRKDKEGLKETALYANQRRFVTQLNAKAMHGLRPIVLSKMNKSLVKSWNKQDGNEPCWKTMIVYVIAAHVRRLLWSFVVMANHL